MLPSQAAGGEVRFECNVRALAIEPSQRLMQRLGQGDNKLADDSPHEWASHRRFGRWPTPRHPERSPASGTEGPRSLHGHGRTWFDIGLLSRAGGPLDFLVRSTVCMREAALGDV